MILTALPATNVRTARRGDGGLHPGIASQITMQAGNGQSAIAGTSVPTAPAVLVRDQLEQPVAGVPIQFVVVGGSSASEVTADTFTRANENPLAGNWTKAGGTATNLQLLNNVVQGVTAGGEGMMFYNAVAWPADHYSECQVSNAATGGGGPAVRMLAATKTAYIAQVHVAGTAVSLAKFVAGTYTQLQDIPTTVLLTDTIRLEVRGSTLRAYKNGLQLGTAVIDGSITTGAAGLDYVSNTTGTLDNWAGGVPPSTSGSVNPDTPIFTDATGIAAATFWTLGTVAGTNTLTVTVPGLRGSALNFTATGTGGGGVATQLALNAGNNQSSVVGTNVATPPSVIVRDASNAPVAGVLVTFAIASGGGSLTGASQTTNASGVATVGSWTLGSTVGTNTLTAASAGLTGSPVTFTATGTTPATFNFYVSPTGGTGTGAIGDPWSLTYALSGAGGALTPGKVVGLRGGTYTGAFTASLSGTAANPVTFRTYPGERATVDGTLHFTGNYLWIWGWEIFNSAPASGGGSGWLDDGLGNKKINCIVHDANNQGIAENNNGQGGEIYGCLVYNNGVTFNLCHGMYLHNVAAAPIKYVRDNIVFNNWCHGIQLYFQSASNNHIYLDGNVVFGSGSVSSPTNHGANLLLSGVMGVDLQLTNNLAYEPSTQQNVLVFNDSTGGTDLLVNGNYLAGGNNKCLYVVGAWSAANVQNNTLYCPSGQLVLTPPGSGAWIWTNNTHYRSGAVNAWTHNGTATTYAGWKTASGLGSADTNPAAAPTGTQVFVRPNAYEAGRGHVVIYNWDGLATVNVDLSTILSVGQAYEVVNAQDYYGSLVLSGTYAGGTVAFPMAGIAAVAPIGRTYTTPPVTGPTFQVFVVRLQAPPISTLLFEELFAGTTQAYYEGRGWYDGTAGITAGTSGDGYQFLTDPTLNRNVLFAHWALASTTNVGGPGVNGQSWRLLLDTTKTGTGATVYLLWKTHNWITRASNTGGVHWVRFARGFGQFTGTNTNGQMDLELVSNLGPPDGFTQILDTATHANPAPNLPVSSLYWSMGNANHLMHLSNTIADDVWYETACYVLPSSGDNTPDGVLRVNVRPYGSTTWTNVMNGVNIGTAFLGPIPSITHVQYFMLGPYISNTVRWTDDIRQYWATIRVYAGDATTDGTL